jgi:hypothetical protein
MMFGSDGGAGPAEHPGGAASASEDCQQQMPVPFSGGRKPTLRFVRIVSMQDSNAATTATGTGGRREPGTDRTTTTQVSSNAGAPPPFPSCSRVWSRAAKTSAIGGLPPTLFFSSQSPDACLRAAIATPPKFRSLGLHLELLLDPSFKTRLHFYPFSLLVLARVPLQTFLDFNTMYILIE